ncbi:MAG: hypothetical protein VCF25_28705 [Candidatus Poribacteria bacterium]
MKIDTKDWFQIKVIAKGDTFEGYYDGKFIAEIKDKGLRQGKVGARSTAVPLISMTLM